jgi:hypothetical protein
MSGLLLPSLLEWNEYEFDGFRAVGVCAGLVVGTGIGLGHLEFDCFWAVSASYVYVNGGGGVVNICAGDVYMFDGVEN